MMKKFRLIIVAVVLLIGLALGSCSHKLCPAYADADMEQPESTS